MPSSGFQSLASIAIFLYCVCASWAAGRLSLSLNGLATDLDTEHGGTDANKRDGARQVGRLNVASLQL